MNKYIEKSERFVLRFVNRLLYRGGASSERHGVDVR